MIVKSLEQLKLPYKNRRLSPLRSIKLYCKLACCCNDRESWVNYIITDCILYRYRLGKGIRHFRNKQLSKPNNQAEIEPSTDRQEKNEKM